MKKEKCPICHIGGLSSDTKTLQYEYQGATIAIADVTAQWCSHCGEALTGPGETERVMREMAKLQKQIDMQQKTPEFLARVRQKLGMSQRGAGEFFGGGVNAFHRYENGQAKPPRSLVQLFGLLDKNPELIHELR